MGIPMLKIRELRGRLIFNMGIPILVRRHLYTETPSHWSRWWLQNQWWPIVLGKYWKVIKLTEDDSHDDFIKWKHFPYYYLFMWGIHRSPVNSPHKGHWRGALMFSLICLWINGWVNNREAGDLRRYCAHYDVTVKVIHIPVVCGMKIRKQAISSWPSNLTLLRHPTFQL